MRKGLDNRGSPLSIVGEDHLQEGWHQIQSSILQGGSAPGCRIIEEVSASDDSSPGEMYTAESGAGSTGPVSSGPGSISPGSTGPGSQVRETYIRLDERGQKQAKGIPIFCFFILKQHDHMRTSTLWLIRSSGKRPNPDPQLLVFRDLR